ncbi:MAG: hypothetical protein PHQ75_02715 [Thermoguttaceae bacterium]|nr:hypothetical protein [Thermoguttaceae bacterium]
MQLREFKTDGIEEFRKYLRFCRDNKDSISKRLIPQPPPPFHLLEDDSLTIPILPRIELEQKRLPLKKDIADYLHPKFLSLPMEKKMKCAGLWSWLALFYYDSVCPSIDGVREVYNDYRYIFEPTCSYYYYRHLVFMTWRIKEITPDHNRLMLASPTHIQDVLCTTILKSLYLTRIPCIFEVIDRLYWDEKLQGPKKGCITTKTKPGGLEHRLTIRIRQLEKTYDLLSLSADQLLELLGEEFSQKY